ncbi:oxidoreductase [Aspergillus karnatakaensis]|uniref:oxidoreductase n=1 Tax=Aspergillus karnatakaensis TaxID=1810916 RepID=UPI003CCD6047
MAPLNTAIIGYGFSAKTFHIPFILHNPGYQLYAIVQRKPTPTNSAASDFPDAKIYHDAYEAIADKNVDVVVITSTNDTHFPLTMAALKGGKHVIVEKPFTVTYKEAAELADLAERTKLVLAVYHNRRWDSDFLTLRSLLSHPTKPLGEITRLRSHFDCAPNSRTALESRKWRLAPSIPGSGMLFDLGSHLLDQAVNLFGTPRAVTCFLFDEVTGKSVCENGFVDDGFIILLAFKRVNGVVELHSTQYSVTDRQKRFEILGTKGRWVKFGLDGQEEQLQRGIGPGDEGYGVETRDTSTLQIVDGQGVKTLSWESARGGYQHFYQNVHDVICSGGQAELEVKPTDAAFVMRLIELCRLSAVEGRTVEVTR